MELGAAGPSEVDGGGGAPASGQGQTGGKSDDRLEFQLEVVALILLAVSGLALWQGESKGLLHEIATNLMASAIVGLVLLVAYGRLLRKKSKEAADAQRQLLLRAVEGIIKVEQRGPLEETLVSEAVGKALVSHLPMIAVAEELGLTNVRVDRPTGVINEAVLKARHTVNILEISLYTMRSITPSEWTTCKAKDIRFILLDPMYPASATLALQRDSEEDQRPGQILKEVHDFLHKLPRQWLDREGSRVRLAKTMPTLSYFRIDDTAYFSPLVHKQVGDATLHLELAEGGLFFDVLAKHFEALWEDTERVAPARPDKVPRGYPDTR